MDDLSDKIVFITGAASGIGAATAKAFAEQGCELVIADLDRDGLAATADAVVKAGGKAHQVILDVTDEGRYQEVAADIANMPGVPHILVNNAGIGVHGSFLNTPMDEVRKVIEINFFGVYNGCRAFLPMMLEANDDRHIVNVASLASISPMPNMSAYAASKYAVDGLTEVMAMELVDSRVGVTCVHPGIINTPIVQGKSYNGSAGHEQERRLGEFYQTNGSDPSVVANGIVDAVTKGCAHLYVGSKAQQLALLKRLSPALTRKLSIKTALKIGYA